MRTTVIITLLFLLTCAGCSSPTAASKIGPPLVIKGLHGYYANPAAELPLGVTVNPETGALIYPPDFGHQ